MAERLIIGAEESIKLRDKGRYDAWNIHFEMELKSIVRDDVCPSDCNGGKKYGSQDDCTGPLVSSLFFKGVIWRCSVDTCDCCGQDMDMDIPNTDFKGNSIGYNFDRKPFDPEVVEVVHV